eukprot:729386-Pelagomonas_calceolata.AAC.6
MLAVERGWKRSSPTPATADWLGGRTVEVGDPRLISKQADAEKSKWEQQKHRQRHFPTGKALNM